MSTPIPRVEPVMVIVLFAASVLLTLRLFPGLENELAYAGNVFQILYPGAFAGDVFRPPEASLSERPLQLSAFYALAWLIGDIWLDDRFVALVNVALAFAGFWALDRIVRRLGLTNIWGRAFVTVLFLKSHSVLSNITLPTNPADFNHVTFAIPLVFWLFDAVIARKGVVVILGWALMLSVFSVRTAAIPVAMTLLIMALSGASRFERLTGQFLFVVCSLTALLGIAFVLDMHTADRMRLWDVIRIEQEDDANPLFGFDMARALALAFWLAVVAFSVRILPPSEAGHRAAQLLIVGTGICAAFALYISFAPAPIRHPILIGFAPTRAMGWLQMLAFVAIAAAMLTRLRWDGGAISLVAPMVLVVLMLSGQGHLMNWVPALGLGLVAAGLLFFLARKRERSLPSPMFAAAVTVCVAVGLSFAASARSIAEDWASTLHHGVHGANKSAPWIDVAPYISTNTPEDAVILGMAELHKGSATHYLWARSLAVRTGRAMPIPETFSPKFLEPDFLDFVASQQRLLDEARTRVLEKAPVGDVIVQLRPLPDFLILPVTLIAPDLMLYQPYVAKDTIGKFMILERENH